MDKLNFSTAVKTLIVCTFFTAMVNGETLAKHLLNQTIVPHNQNAGGASSDEKHAVNEITSITVTAVELTDNTGLVYIGGVVDKAELTSYLTQMKGILGDEFGHFRQAQKARDHHQFHVTLINPFELKELKSQDVTSILSKQQALTFKLDGLGRVSKKQSHAYFVVAQSKEAQLLRNNLQLKNKDFHITLGFSPNDVFGIAKDRTSLVIK